MAPDNKEPDTELSSEKKLFYSFPALTGLSGGLFACAVAGFSSVTLLGTALLTLAGAFVGRRLLKQRQNDLQKLSTQYRQDQFEQLTAINAYATELERLFLEVTPILLRQVQTSRLLTEREITALTGQFAAMAIKLEEIIAGSAHIASADLKTLLSSDKNDAGMLSSNSECIYHEICAILVAFQFQDRVSQMLAHVENNLAFLNETVQSARGQGTMRHAGMIDIEQTLQRMKLDYSLPEQHINHQANQAVDNKPENDDELTFF